MASLIDTAREHRVATSAAIGIGILVLAVLAYLFQPWQLFLDTRVDEAFPVQVSPVAEDEGAPDPQPDPAPEAAPSPEPEASPSPAPATPAPDAATSPEPGPAPEPAPESEAAAEATPEPSPAPEATPEPEPTEATGPTLLLSGEFQDRSHPTSGTVGIFEFEDGSRVLRIEDLETDNGPDLYVYLSAADADAEAGEFDDEFVSLGRLKGNIGSQNYNIPADVDLSRYASVVIWCDRFDVAFGSAALSPA